jgi:iron-sulfur cluster repair protein YtfE (RIC family)
VKSRDAASDDPLHTLEHDHGLLNQQVLAIGPLVAALDRGDLASAAEALSAHLAELRDCLFLHFAREEEALFPFLMEIAPGVESSVTELVSMHDEICGSVSRMVHIAGDRQRCDSISVLFDRFETVYARHAQAERLLLENAAARLNIAQRRELAALIAGI